MDRPSDMQPTRAELIRFTYQDYLGFPDDGRRHEIVDGEHLVTPAPAPRHQALSVRLVVAIANYLSTHPIGQVYAAPLDIVLSDANVVQPDVVFVSRARLEIIGARAVQGAPELVVEILSPASRRTDEIAKRHLYDRYGVSEYWIVDPEVEIVKVYRRTEDGGLARTTELSCEHGHVLETPLLPEFALDLRKLFAD